MTEEAINKMISEAKTYIITDNPSLRADLLKYVSSMSKQYSNIDDMISDANHLLAWINDKTFPFA
jgi:c-di-GMP-related signal transduction protein